MTLIQMRCRILEIAAAQMQFRGAGLVVSNRSGKPAGARNPLR